jgi:hypothetical protein
MSNYTCKAPHNSSGADADGGIFKIQNPYAGIPQNLLVNSIAVAILVVLFFLLRKRSTLKAIGHIARTDDIQKWTGLFFSAALDNVKEATRFVRRRDRDGGGHEVEAAAQEAQEEALDQADVDAHSRASLNVQVSVLCCILSE